MPMGPCDSRKNCGGDRGTVNNSDLFAQLAQEYKKNPQIG